MDKEITVDELHTSAGRNFLERRAVSRGIDETRLMCEIILKILARGQHTCRFNFLIKLSFCNYDVEDPYFWQTIALGNQKLVQSSKLICRFPKLFSQDNLKSPCLRPRTQNYYLPKNHQ